MALQAITCPGYYETGEGQIQKAPSLEGNIAILHEVEEEIRVLCTKCVEGRCVSVSEKEGDGMKQAKCFYLRPAYKNTPHTAD